MKKKITLDRCKGCDDGCGASNRHVNPPWRNIYCEAHDCHTITEEDDKKGFPDWCPLKDDIGLSHEDLVYIRMFIHKTINSCPKRRELDDKLVALLKVGAKQ